MQRERKSFSGRAPGGRTRPGFQFLPKWPLIRSMGTVAAPDNAEAINCLRDKSGPRISPEADGAIRYVIK